VRPQIGLILLAAAAGCQPGAPTPSDAPVEPPAPTVAPPALPTAADGPESAEPTRFPFIDPRVRDRFVRADMAARRLLGSENAGLRYWSAGPRGDRAGAFRLFWDGPATPPPGGTPRGDVDHRRIEVDVERDPTAAGRPVRGFRVYAYWAPPGNEGKALVILEYGAHPTAAPDGVGTVELKLDRPGLPRSLQNPRIHAIERLPPDSAVTGRRVGDRDYTIGLDRADAPWPGGGTIARAEPHLRRYFASADSFRRAALADLDRLEKAVRDGVTGGAAVAEYPPDRIERTEGGHPIRIPSLRAGPPARPGKGLPEPLKADALAELIAQIEHDRQLIKEHAAGMHAALRKTFPLDEVFADPGGK